MNHCDPSVLLSRVVDREAASADWDALMHLAESDPALWTSGVALWGGLDVDVAGVDHEGIGIRSRADRPFHHDGGQGFDLRGIRQVDFQRPTVFIDDLNRGEIGLEIFG